MASTLSVYPVSFSPPGPIDNRPDSPDSLEPGRRTVVQHSVALSLIEWSEQDAIVAELFANFMPLPPSAPTDSRPNTPPLLDHVPCSLQHRLQLALIQEMRNNFIFRPPTSIPH